MTTTRDRLEDIFNGNQSGTQAEFERKWAEFAARTDHTVRMINPPLADEQRWLVPKMNCFPYSLGLHNLPEYIRWIREHQAISSFNGQFMHYLIEQEFLREIKGTDIPVNSLVVYYNCKQITHCGTILRADMRVRSKSNVHEFYEHGLFEVQTSFGLPRKFLEPPTNDVRKMIIAELWCI